MATEMLDLSRSSEFWRSPKIATLLVFGFALLILAVSSIPAGRMPKSPELWRWDKAVHAAEYAVLATLLFRALMMRGGRLGVVLVVASSACCVFGFLDETYQSTIPGRDSSVYDMLADSVGACFACLASAVLYSRPRRQHAHSSNL